MKRLLLVVALLGLSASALAQSPVPYRISYQGRVSDASGNLIGANAPVNRKVTFRIYKHPTSMAAADRLYSEEQTVTITAGEFSVLIGAGTAVTGELNLAADSQALALAFNQDNSATPRYLGVTIDDPAVANDPEILPRQQFVSSAYALRADLAQYATAVTTPLPAASIGAGAVTAEKLAASAVTTDRVASGAITTDKIANGTITADDLAGGSVSYGKIAHHTVDSAIIIDGEVKTADLAASAVTTAKIADGAITREKLAAGATSFFASSVTIRATDSDPSANFANQLMLQDAADSNKQLILGYDANGYGAIQAVQHGVDYKALKLNPAQGRVEIGPGGLDVAGKVSIWESDLETRSGGFGFYHSTIKPFGSSGYERDGPLVYGWNGGGLGTMAGTRKVALTWNDVGVVNFRANGDYNTRLDVAYESSAWTLSSHTLNTAFRRLKLVGSGLTVETRGDSDAFSVKNSSNVNLLLLSSVGNLAISGAYTSGSDRRIKHNINPLAGALEKLLRLSPVTFEYNDTTRFKAGVHAGFIAQDMETVFPEWVFTEDDGMKSIGFRGFESYTVQALRELRAEKDEQLRQRDATIASLEKNVAAMKAESAETKARLAQLERALATLTAAASND
jgi:hypothetical protein